MWSHTISWMIGLGRRYLAHRFWTHQGPAYLGEQFGSQIFPLFHPGTDADGGSTVCFADAEVYLVKLVYGSVYVRTHVNSISDFSALYGSTAVVEVLMLPLVARKGNWIQASPRVKFGDRSFKPIMNEASRYDMDAVNPACRHLTSVHQLVQNRIEGSNRATSDRYHSMAAARMYTR